jgi:YD repeat-containing protein
MGFDDRGSYDTVAYPDNATPACSDYPARTVDDDDYDQLTGCDDVAPATESPTRYCVDYTFDPFRFTDIAVVIDNHGVTATATYDPLTGRIAGRVDENGNPTSWTYDAAGRLATITAPRERGSGSPTVRYSYGGLRTTANPAGAPFAWASAAHHDVVNPTDPLTTVAFVDGLDRTVQRKRDSVVEGVTGQSRTVEGAVDFDALGREVAQWYPIVETAAAATLTTYNGSTARPARRRRTSRRRTRLAGPTTCSTGDWSPTLPDGSKETTAYTHAVVADPDGYYGSGPVTLLKQTDTDPLGQATSTWADVGGAVYRNELAPAAANNPTARPARWRRCRRPGWSPPASSRRRGRPPRSPTGSSTATSASCWPWSTRRRRARAHLRPAEPSDLHRHAGRRAGGEGLRPGRQPDHAHPGGRQRRLLPLRPGPAGRGRLLRRHAEGVLHLRRRRRGRERLPAGCSPSPTER